MNVQIRLFARAREIAGAEVVTVRVQEGATVKMIREQLALDFPALANLLVRCALAVDGEFADDAQLVPARAEIAVLPPVSGGTRP
jgi:molybdopterin converting factor subunit 1